MGSQWASRLELGDSGDVSAVSCGILPTILWDSRSFLLGHPGGQSISSEASGFWSKM